MLKNLTAEMLKRRRTFLKWLCAVLALLLLSGLVAWRYSDRLLTVDSGPVTGDVLVVLGGGGGERPKRAAELYKKQAAPKILCTGDGDCESNRRMLIDLGVPADAILTECESRNTWENARNSIALLRAQGFKRVILVTSWYHSRRALNCFRHCGDDLEFFSRPSYFGAARESWNQEGVRKYIKAEYAKLLGYWVSHGVCPF